MKISRLFCMAIAVAGFSCAAFAVNALTENFNGPTMGFTVLAGGSQGSNTTGTFDGSGHYVMTQDSYIYRWVNTGNFSMQTNFNSINMGTPPEPNASNYRVFNYLINHTGDNGEYIVVFFYKSAAKLQFSVDAKIGSAAQARQYTEDLSSLTSATLQVTWNETSKTYVISAGFNGGAITQKASITMVNPSNVNRTEYFYGVSLPLGTSQPSMSFDQYTMTAGQTPYGQIDSMDDLSSWQSLGTQGSLDTTTFHEGTGSMKMTYGSGLGWDVAPYLVKQFNFGYSSASAITFWEKSALTGKERVNQLILVDTAGHATRYSCSLPANSNWNKVSCPISSFVPDGAAADMNSIRSIQIWFTSYDVMGSAVWFDDLEVEMLANQPKPPFIMSATDNIGTEGWSDTRSTGLMVQENTIVKQGTGSMKITYPGPLGTYDVVPRKTFAPAIDFNDYTKQAISIWLYGDMVGDSRMVQFIVYDNQGHTGRYVIPAATVTGWRQVIMPLKNFAWEVSSTQAPIDVSQVNWRNIGAIDLWFSSYPNPGNSVYIDDIEAMNYTPPQPSLAWVMNAQKVSSPLTIDGNPADWASLTDSDWLDFDLKAVPVQPNGNMHVKYKFAWDNNYLYVLVQEVAGDTLATEAQGIGAKYGLGLNDQGGGDVYYDNLALFFDFTRTHHPGNATDIALWLYCGLSSTNRTDMMMAWTNGNWGPHDPCAITNGSCATSGTLGHRVFEGKVKWSDLASDIQAARLPASGLLSAIKPGYVFGCNPRLDDLEADWTATSEAGSAWLNGNLWTNLPSGKDIYSTDVRLVCKAADLNGDCAVNFSDFALLAQQWLMNSCSDLNGYCGGADMFYGGTVGTTDLGKFASEWLK